MSAYIVFIIGLALVVALSIASGYVFHKFGVKRDDAEQAEYLSKYSAARRAQKDVPIMLRKQAD